MDIELTLDGKVVQAEDNARLADILKARHSKVPLVCYHEQLGPIQTCDTCVVEINGEMKRACSTQVSAGMNVVTNSARARQAQKRAYNHLLANHLLYCTVCDNNNGNCTVHNDAERMELTHQEIEFRPKPYDVDRSNPFYRYDPDQCVLCGRCVEACQNIQVNETLSIRWEDQHPRVLWDGGKKIGESSCVSCGHCVSVCPCNALMETSMVGEAGYMTKLPAPALDGMIDVVKALEPDTGLTPLFKVSKTEATMREARTRRTKIVCTYCGVGCSFDLWTKGRHILKVAPLNGPVNGISTCVKGKFGWDFVNSPDRLQHPLIRENGKFRKATWDEALDLIQTRFAEIKKKHGPDALGFVASSKCTNEEAYLMQKLARGVIGTNNIDNCSRYCQSPATKGLTRTVGIGGDSGSIQDITLADLVITIGSNTAESHPVLAARVKEAHKRKKQKLVVVDIRRHEMAERADFFLHPKPGTDLIWLLAVTRHIIDSGRANVEFITRWVNGFEDYKSSLNPFTLQYAAAICEISIEDLKQLADMIVNASRVCILWAMGVTQRTMGSDTSTAISNLLLITGNYMRPGTGAYPLRGHNNVQGTGDHGCAPDQLPGYQEVNDPKIRAKFEAAWKVKLSAEKGLDNHEMIGAIHAGQLKSMYVYGEEISLVESNIHDVMEALSKLEFFVMQEIFFTKTCQLADVILPACPSVEKDGTFTNTERRIQRTYKVWDPVGQSRPDWQIIQDIANRLNAGWTYQHPSEIYDEISRLCPHYAGITYERLKGYKSLQWPVAADGTDQPLLYTKNFEFPDGKAKLYPLELRLPQDQPNTYYDLHLNNGRLLEHFHEGNMTYRVQGIAEQVPDTFVEISPKLAQERGIHTGSRVKLISRYGELELKALVTDRVQGNEVYVPVNSAESRVNMLTGAHYDHVTHTPAYKENSVRLEVLHRLEESPLPLTNHRFATRTPQAGIEVERRWKREDYTFPLGVPLPPKAKDSEMDNG